MSHDERGLVSQHGDRSSREARDYLVGLTLHGIKLGFDNINFLLAAAGDPHRTFRSVHVAGTNGKGSVVAMTDAILRAAGYSVCRFTSPHLLDLRERFLLNAEPIPEAALVENIAFFRAAAAAMDPPPTFFELCTAVAFRWFAACQPDVAVVEVGMGGRLDSTNVLSPLATAVTNIDLEHTAYLGDTLEKIAWEKAGIIKPGIPVAVGERRVGPRDVILARAAALDAPAALLGRDFTCTLAGPAWAQRLSYHGPRFSFDDAPLGLAGSYQGENAALALALAESLADTFPRVTSASAQAGIAAARWPCRLEKVIAGDDASPTVIIDVAHNVAGAKKLAEAIEGCVTILSTASDKDAAGMIDILAPKAKTLVLTEFDGKRALPLADLARAAGTHPHECVPGLREAIRRGLALASPTHPLLITGSIYTAGEARQILIEEHGAPNLTF
jgi:dihydrofolate synthase/folylpolyglutamate synthase